MRHDIVDGVDEIIDSSQHNSIDNNANHDDI